MAPVRVFVSSSMEDSAFCAELTGALRAAGADVWRDEQRVDFGQLMVAIELEVRSRPVFIVILSPAALRSGRVYAECTWAATYQRQDPRRVFLPVLAEPVNPNALRAFLQDFQPLAVASVELYPRPEAIWRTLSALSLAPTPSRPSSASRSGPIDRSLVPVAPRMEQPETVEGLLTRGNMLLVQGRPQEGLELLQRAAQWAPDSAQVQFQLGHALNTLERYADALAAFESSIEHDEGSPLAWASKANALDGLKRYDEALEACDTALMLDPNSAFAWNNKGVALLGIGRPIEALAAYDAALMRDPNSADYWRNKGLVLARLQRHEEALAAFDHALSINHNFAPGWASRANALFRLQRYEESLAACERAVTLDPRNTFAWNRTASVLARLRRYTEALAACDRALALDATYVAAWSNKGGSLAMLERYTEALAACDRALALDPNYAPAWKNETLVLRALGREAEANEAEARAKALGG